MVTTGRVRVWQEEEGWGVIDSPETPGGCFAHYSAVLAPGYRGFDVGQEVDLEWEEADQDGFGYLATAVWPAGQPRPAEPPSTDAGSGTGAAYSSTLTLTFDDGRSRPETEVSRDDTE